MTRHNPDIKYDMATFREEEWSIGRSMSRWFEKCQCDGFRTKKSGFMMQEISWYQDNPNNDDAKRVTWFACDDCFAEFRKWFEAKTGHSYELGSLSIT